MKSVHSSVIGQVVSMRRSTEKTTKRLEDLDLLPALYTKWRARKIDRRAGQGQLLYRIITIDSSWMQNSCKRLPPLPCRAKNHRRAPLILTGTGTYY